MVAVRGVEIIEDAGIRLTSHDRHHFTCIKLPEMPETCKSYTKHRLCTTFSVAKQSISQSTDKLTVQFTTPSLTIEFPHRKWASDYQRFLQDSTYHADCNPRVRGTQNNHVRLDLPQKLKLDRVQLQDSDDYGGSLVFAFEDYGAARAWHAGSGLWRDADEANQLKLTLPLSWSHQDFEAAIRASSTSGGNDSENDREDKRTDRRASFSTQKKFK